MRRLGRLAMRTNYPFTRSPQCAGRERVRAAGSLRQNIPPIPKPERGNGIIEIASQMTANSSRRTTNAARGPELDFTIQKRVRGGFVARAVYLATRHIKKARLRELNYALISAGQQRPRTRPRYGLT